MDVTHFLSIPQRKPPPMPFRQWFILVITSMSAAMYYSGKFAFGDLHSVVDVNFDHIDHIYWWWGGMAARSLWMSKLTPALQKHSMWRDLAIVIRYSDKVQYRGLAIQPLHCICLGWLESRRGLDSLDVLHFRIATQFLLYNFPKAYIHWRRSFQVSFLFGCHFHAWHCQEERGVGLFRISVDCWYSYSWRLLSFGPNYFETYEQSCCVPLPSSLEVIEGWARIVVIFGDNG